jgi:GNAT superfamily N-acetyltransferase
MIKLLEHLEYENNGVPGKTVFKCLLEEDENFIPMFGLREETVALSADGFHLREREAAFPMFHSNHYLYVVDNKAVGFFAFKENRRDYLRQEVSILHLLYLDKKESGKGFAKKIILKLKEYALEVDSLCKNKEKFLNQTINEPYFCIGVYPNPFSFEAGKEPDLQKELLGKSNLDWTIEKETSGRIPADKHMLDQVMDGENFEVRKTAKELKDFYEKNGFRQCDALQFITLYDEEEKTSDRQLCVSPKTFANMARTPLVFPACNADLIEMTDEVIRKATKKDAEICPKLILQETRMRIEDCNEKIVA